MFVVVFVTAKTRNNANPSTLEWINKLSYFHVIKYYTGVEMNEPQPCAPTWMNLMLSKKEKVVEEYT